MTPIPLIIAIISKEIYERFIKKTISPDVEVSINKDKVSLK